MSPRPERVVAVWCFLLWLAAAVCARRFGIWLAIGSIAIGLGGALLALEPGRSRERLRPSLRRVLLGIAGGAVSIASTYAVYPVLARAVAPLGAETERLYAAFHGPSPLVAALALAPIILGEELVWRGTVQDALVRRFGTPIGVGAAACAYACAHAPLGSLALIFCALVLGSFWGALSAASSSLVPALIAHALWDAAVLLIAPLR